MTGLRARASIRVAVCEEPDVYVARMRAREIALREGFPEVSVAATATAVAEIARNIVVHAGAGEILLEGIEDHGRRGILVVARDRGPGISDVHRAMQDGYSTAAGLGLGLPSARRLMDEFTLVSVLGEGTTVTMKKWGA